MDRQRVAFTASVEASRMGTIFAHDGKAHARWRRADERKSGRSSALTPAALDAAVRSLAATNPEYVVNG